MDLSQGEMFRVAGAGLITVALSKPCAGKNKTESLTIPGIAMIDSRTSEHYHHK